MISRVGKSWAWTIIQAFLTATLICLIYWAWLMVRSPEHFPVRNIKIIAAGKHVSQEKIQELVINNFRGGFFSFQGAAIKNAVLSDPWLASVSVRRIWPDTIEVAVKERTAILQWNSTQLVDQSGDLFQPPESSFPKNLPQLLGPQNNFKEMYGKYLRYTVALAALGLAIETLKESDRLSWTLHLNNNISVILGERDPDERFDRFAQHYQKLIGDKSACVDYVDLRYPDGMTIRWKNLDKTQKCPAQTPA